MGDSGMRDGGKTVEQTCDEELSAAHPALPGCGSLRTVAGPPIAVFAFHTHLCGPLALKRIVARIRAGGTAARQLAAMLRN